MDRRSALGALALAALAPAAPAFNLKALDDYRRHHLFILAHAEDEAGRAFAERIAQVLAERLPESRAQTVLVPEIAGLAAFLVSQQFDVAVMAQSAADALAAGRAPFADHGPVQLRALYSAGGYLLVCRAEFLEDDARRIADALGVSGAANAAVPFHRGVRAP